MRNQFTFYKSFDDVIEDLSDKQIAEYIKVMLDVQFLRVKIDDVEFTDKTLSIVWKSQKHSISTSIKGYLDGQKRDTVKNPYLGVYGNNSNPYLGVRQQEKEEVQDKEKEKEEVKDKAKEKNIVCREFSFSLSRQSCLANTSKEYQARLKEYIDSSNKPMSYEDFYTQCEMKPYKYKNFKMAYDTWNKNAQTRQPPQSFKQQDAKRTEDALGAFLAAREQGFDLRNISSEDDVQDAEVIEG